MVEHSAYGTFDHGISSEENAALAEDKRSQCSDAPCKRFESDGSFISRLFFCHIRYLLAIQKQRNFTLDDVWQLAEPSTSQVVSKQLLQFFQQNDGNLSMAILKMEWRALLASGLLVLLTIPFKLAPALLVFTLLQRLEVERVDAYQVLGFLAGLHFATMMCTLLECHAKSITTHMAGRFVSGCHSIVLQATIPEAPHDINEMGSVAFLYSGMIETLGILLTDGHALWSVLLEIIGEIYILSPVLSVDWRLIGMFFAFVGLLIVLSAVFESFFKVRSGDHRTNRWKSIEECFRSIQSVKLNAWEKKFMKRVEDARETERKSVLEYLVSLSVSRGITWGGDEFVVGLIFMLVVWRGLPFTPAVAFSSVIVMQFVKSTLSTLVWLTSLLPDGIRAVKALEVYFRIASHQVEPVRCPQDSSGSNQVLFSQSAYIGYDKKPSDCILTNVNLSVERGQLVILYGKAGEGKTTLLKALLGQIPCLQGAISVSNECRIAYCSQEPWVQSLTIQENILFGSTYDKAKYRAVLDACALSDDLGRLPKGDTTVVGSRGINLSGGQKARLALARACYADADLYVLDCPLASVDAVVQMDVFRKCIVELLRYKTVVMATHNAEFIHSLMVDQLWEVRNQSVTVGPGNRSRVVVDCFSQRVQAYESSYGTLWSRRINKCLESPSKLVYDAQHGPTALKLGVGAVKFSDNPSSGLCIMEDTDMMHNVRMLSPSTRESLCFVCMAGLSVSVFEACLISRNFWLAWWSSQADMTVQASWDFVLVYECLVVGGFGALLTHEAFVSYTVSGGVHEVFRAIVRALLKAPLSFYYRARSMEVLDRFIMDMDTCDYGISTTLVPLFRSFALVVGSLAVLSYLLGYVGVIITILVVALGLHLEKMNVFVQGALLEGEIGSMDGGELSEALDGIAVIRAFGDQTIDHFVSRHGIHMDSIYRLRVALLCFKSSERLRIECVNGLFMVALSFVLITSDSTPAQLGLSVVYIMCLYSDAMSFFSSCGRVFVVFKSLHLHALASIRPEEQETTIMKRAEAVSLSESWILRGEITFENVWFRYDNSSYALQDVSFAVAPGTKIGVVGRTGSGKSSLAMALFRVHELVRGRIRVDDVDIRSLRLETLRSHMNIILQSPMFYRCTVREYLDPFSEFSDNDLWQVIHKTGMSPHLQTLHTQLHENGDNWSLGQRQLLCLARSLLRPSKIVILDEPFSSIDGESDKQLLSVLSSELRESTVLFVTHRLDQVLTFCEKILVLKDGEVEDFGVVEELVGRSDGVFFELLENTLLTR